ncbi:MAG: hypothetical protein IJW05_04810 [Lentisphaeria bacterium]|nr:hypothetical protein [Lentisphaeria bacterium]
MGKIISVPQFKEINMDCGTDLNKRLKKLTKLKYSDMEGREDHPSISITFLHSGEWCISLTAENENVMTFFADLENNIVLPELCATGKTLEEAVEKLEKLVDLGKKLKGYALYTYGDV